MNYLVTGQVQPAAEAQITAIIAQMDGPSPRRIPNRRQDTTQVIGLQYQGGTTRQVRSDLFVLRLDRSEVYFEMKTVKPNKNTFRDMKRDILMIMAMCCQQNAQAYAAMSYNPVGEGSIYTPQFNEFLELGADLIVGRQFWNFIGDAQTYDELLEIAEEVCTVTTPLIAAANQQNRPE